MYELRMFGICRVIKLITSNLITYKVMEKLKSVCLSVCKSLNISEKIASEWITRIMSQYSEENRFYHNVEMLDKKMELVEELSASNQELRNSLALAVVFQYFHFDGKRDHKEENSEEFRLFASQADIKDVSLLKRNSEFALSFKLFHSPN